MAKEILVVDDEPDFRELARTLLSDEGYKVTTAACGEEALGLLEGGTMVDAIVLDLRMPKISGAEVASQIRSSPALHDIPVIIVTADVTARKNAHLLESVSGIIDKPFEVESFLIEIKRYFA